MTGLSKCYSLLKWYECMWLLFFFRRIMPKRNVVCKTESLVYGEATKKKNSTLIVVNEVYCVTKSFESDAFCRCERLRVFRFVCVAFTVQTVRYQIFSYTLIQIYRDGVISMGFHALYLAHKTIFVYSERGWLFRELEHDLHIFAADRIVKSLILNIYMITMIMTPKKRCKQNGTIAIPISSECSRFLAIFDFVARNILIRIQFQLNCGQRFI